MSGAKKPKHRQEIESLIVRAHRAGVCDSYGNSVAREDGTPMAKPRVLSDTERLKDVSAEDTALAKFQAGWIP
jgi:hypothetical protein